MDKNKIISDKERDIIQKDILFQIINILDELKNPNNFKKKNVMNKISIVKEGDELDGDE